MVNGGGLLMITSGSTGDTLLGLDVDAVGDSCCDSSRNWNTPLPDLPGNWDMALSCSDTDCSSSSDRGHVLRGTSEETGYMTDPNQVFLLPSTINTFAGPCHAPGSTPLPDFQNMTSSPGLHLIRSGRDLAFNALRKAVLCSA